ncbi:MAG: DNA primase [Anaerolineae bacterium]|nr:DNA primase [Anaerolineae bacterium]
MSVIDEIKERIDIVDVVSENVRLRRAGSSYTGFCPFHDNTRTPAFSVFPETGTWHCFGCGEGGDVFSYLMKREGWDFKETLQYLANRAGVELEPRSPKQQEQAEEYSRLRQLLEEAVLFYQHRLLNTPDGEPARQYLERRGVTRVTIEKFGIGFAPDKWSDAMDHFLSQGYSSEELLNVGLITANEERHTNYDKFRNRILFPIRDARGKMAGFGGRTLDPDGIPKYLNSPQTTLFNKSHLLYGMDLARKAIRDTDQAVIVEGYMDVIIPHQAGFTNTVSPMGTALSVQQLRQLKKITQHIVLALDPDAAGEKATLRGLEIARQTMDHENELAFDARGLLHQEARLQADIRVCQLPEGLDPDEIILQDPQAWSDILGNARPIVIHVMETLAKNQDTDDPKVKGQIADMVLPLIEDVPNTVEREDYRQRLARMLKVDERSLIITGDASRQKPARKPQAMLQQTDSTVLKTAPVKTPITVDLEFIILQLLVRLPETLHQLNRWLLSFNLERLQERDFHHIDHQQMAAIILNAFEQDQQDPEDYIRTQAEQLVDALWTRLNEPLVQGEPGQRQIRENAIRGFVRLRLLYTARRLEQLQFLLQDLENQSELQQMQIDFARESARKVQLDKALRKPLIIA